MTIENMQLEIGKSLARQGVEEFSNTSDYIELMDSDLSTHEKEVCLVLEVYKRIQTALIIKEARKLIEIDQVSVAIKSAIVLMGDIIDLESEIYRQSKIESDQERLESTFDLYPSMVPNEKMNLFEAIEQVVASDL